MSFSKKLFILFIGIYLNSTTVNSQSNDRVKVAFLGTFHFNQMHDVEKPGRNFFSDVRQKEILAVVEKLKNFRPDRLYIEREPRFQKDIDSLYALYEADNIVLQQLENGAGEVYQLAFRLSKMLRLPSPKCINHYESTSQSLLASGSHIERYQNALREFQNLGRAVVGKFLKGEATLLETLTEMNTPQNIELSHQLLFNIPAYVQKGSFSSYENIDKVAIDTNYIGAEFISLFYERNLKIYSNILNAQMANNDKRILIITGQVHVGVLQDLLGKNPNFEIIDVNTL